MAHLFCLVCSILSVSLLYVFVDCKTANNNSLLLVEEISRHYAEAIIERNGGKNSNHSWDTTQFQDYVNRLKNYSANFEDNLNNRTLRKHSNCSRHPNRADSCNSTHNNDNKCYSATELLSLVKLNRSSGRANDGRVTPDDLQLLCPIILQNLENAECSKVEPSSELSREHLRPSSLEVWGYGFLFVTIISLSSVFGAVLLPLMGKAFYHRLLMVLVGLAVGSLSGSAAFHLIPQAYGLLDDPGNHHYLITSLLILCGIYLFFMVERLLRIYFQYCERKRPVQIKRVLSDVEVLKYTSSIVEEQSKDLSVSNGALDATVPPVPSSSNTNPVIISKERTHHHDHQIDFKPGQNSPIATVAWMIVFGDGLHNFIDGLSIGAAFNQSVMTGISISVAVVCEELPHELGDMAILLNSGMTMKQALIYNFLSACTCYLGLIAGTLLGELAEASVYIFAIAGGVFLYISLCDMIPEMNEEVENASRVSAWDALKVIGLQNLGWITGTAILFTLAYYTEEITFE